MPAANPLYDLVLLLDTSAEDARRAEILKTVEAAIGGAGEIVNTQDWGARALSFEIDKKKDADYRLLQFHGTPDLLSQLDRTLRITDEVVRFRIIKLAPGTPAPPEQRAEPRAGADEYVAEDAPEQSAAAEEPVYETAPVGGLGEPDGDES
jgi:small subunit ribosomal protein S6